MKINILFTFILFSYYISSHAFYVNSFKVKTEINLKEKINFSGSVGNYRNGNSNHLDKSSNDKYEEDMKNTVYKDNEGQREEIEKLSMSSSQLNNFDEKNNYQDTNSDLNSDVKNFLKGNSNVKLNSNKNSKSIIEPSDVEQFEKSDESFDLPADYHIDDMGPGPIYGSSWIKYFKMKSNSHNDAFNKNKITNDESFPKNFEINSEFQKEIKLFADVSTNTKSSDGKNILDDYIKNKYLFYAVLLKDSFNIISSRNSQIKKTYETIDIKFLEDVIENSVNNDKNTDGGIQDYGSFSEGFCFKIIMAKPNLESFVICSNEEKVKKQLMIDMKKLRILYQRENGKIIRKDKYIKKDTKNDMISILINKNNENINTSSDPIKPEDGRWIIIQNWSQCTLKCGSGKSYLQRMCIPPKNAGKPCEGEPIMEKSCNTQPCPETKINKNLEFLKNSSLIIVNKPEIRMMSLSKEPLRYRRCVIKEGDMIFFRYLNDTGINEINSNKNSDLESLLPVRAVINNKTFSLFKGDYYDSHVMTFNLNKTDFKRSFEKTQSCFLLSENQEKMARLCPLSFDNQKSKVIEWENDFDSFKNICNGIEKTEEDEKTNISVKSNLKDAVAKLVQQHELDRKEGVYNTYEDSLKNIDKAAFDAIIQEVSLEEIVKNKELQMEDREEKELLDLIEKEKVKKESLVKKIKEKALRNQYNQKFRETMEAMKNIKKAAYKHRKFSSHNSTSLLNFGKMSIKSKKKHKKKIINIRIVI